MHSAGGVDVVALDIDVFSGGGRISGKSNTNHKSDGSTKKGLAIRRGSPETLSDEDELRNRTLFLCYPDEEHYEKGGDEEEQGPPMSMAAACLENFSGSTIIHVGELYADTLSLDQAPFGR
jgi:hypothetical protein